MTAWVALLRAVNVGGKNKMAMADTREMMSDVGFPEATTHLQSGNVLLTSTDEPATIAATIRDAIADRFGHDVDVIMRSREDLDYLITSVPWEYPANSSSGIVFMSGPIEGELDASKFYPDSLVVDGADVHVDIPTGFGKTKLTVAWIEKQTGLRGTRRNWKTVKTLAEKLAALD